MLAAAALAVIIQMECVHNTCVALSDDGRDIVWGQQGPSNVSRVKWFGAGVNSSYAKLADGRVVSWGAIYTEALPSGKYHTPFAVEWTPSGWARPDAGR
jgi:hypothetical protein